jgi:hypothetical protein
MRMRCNHREETKAEYYQISLLCFWIFWLLDQYSPLIFGSVTQSHRTKHVSHSSLLSLDSLLVKFHNLLVKLISKSLLNFSVRLQSATSECFIQKPDHSKTSLDRVSISCSRLKLFFYWAETSSSCPRFYVFVEPHSCIFTVFCNWKEVDMRI